MRKFQTEYESYMKEITDGFAKICSFEGAEGIIAGEGNRVSITLYQHQEFLLGYDKELRHMYRPESHEERIKEFRRKRQEVANKFLNDNTISYEEFVNKFCEV